MSKPKEKQLVVLEVTTVRKYVFREGEINGWTTEQVIEDWFERYPISQRHATRDFHEIGGAEKVLSIRRGKL